MVGSIAKPPATVKNEIAELRAALDAVVPAKAPNNLLIGTWNVRAFDRAFPDWASGPGDSPIRDLSNVACIAEVIRRFDVAAIQEVRQSAQAFLLMMEALGDGLAYVITDVTREGRATTSASPSSSTAGECNRRDLPVSWWLPRRTTPASPQMPSRASSHGPPTR